MSATTGNKGNVPGGNMNKPNILVISLEEAKDILANWWTDTAIGDRQALYESIRNSEPFIPSLKAFSPNDVAETIAELNLAEKYGISRNCDQVVVEIDVEHYVVVWDIRNVEPERLADLIINEDQVVS